MGYYDPPRRGPEPGATAYLVIILITLVILGVLFL